MSFGVDNAGNSSAEIIRPVTCGGFRINADISHLLLRLRSDRRFKEGLLCTVVQPHDAIESMFFEPVVSSIGAICCLASRVERHTVSLYPCCRPPSVIITGRFYDVSYCATHVPGSVLLSSNVFLLSIRRGRKRSSWQMIWT